MNTATVHNTAETKVTRGFLIHLGIFVAVNVGLAALNLTRNPDNRWFLWVAGGWGLGLLLHGLLAFAPLTRKRAVGRVEQRLERRKANALLREQRRKA